MPTTRKSRGSQRKLNFEVEGDNEQTRQHASGFGGKRSSPTLPTPSSSSSTTNKRQKGIASYLSPKKKGKSASIVTPADSARKEAPKAPNDTRDEYVPIYIHKNLEYARKGQSANLSPQRLKVLQWIQEYYEIPKDIEQDRAYGPLSGSSYEDRVIAAYRLGKLTAAGAVATVICTACAELGHERDQCPTLV
jgi:hypothetical protein